MRTTRGLVAVVAAALVLSFVPACSTSRQATNAVPPVAVAGPPESLVTLGGDETLVRPADDDGHRSWALQVFDALAPSAVYTDVATEDATAHDGVVDQLPRAVDLAPTLAVVWFGYHDERGGVPVPTFEEDLARVVRGLQAVGARVLVLSPTGTGTSADAAYQAAARHAAESTGATYVEVPGSPPRRGGPEPATQTAIATAVRAAIGR